MAGFISKWHLGLGAVASGNTWVLAVLVVSSLLNAAYFLPILKTAWFDEPEGPWQETHPRGRWETNGWLLLPPVVTAALTLVVGLFSGLDFSPLGWAELIAGREY